MKAAQQSMIKRLT